MIEDLNDSNETSSLLVTENEDFSFGDIIWHIYPNNTFNSMIRPIFECNTFEVSQNLKQK